MRKKSYALLRRGAARLAAAPLFACCLLALSAADAQADPVTISGSTSGSFTTAPGPPVGTNTGSTLLGLQFISSTFNVTTNNGSASLNGAAANPVTGSTNFNNLGSFYLDPPPNLTLDSYSGASFSLVITFDAPLGINGGQTATFTATLTGQVVNTDLVDTYGINVRFNNPVQTFTYTLADGRTGTFTLTVNDANGITPNKPVALTGQITNASQDPAAVPEPATVVLFGTGLVGALGAARRLRRSNRKAGSG